MMPEHEHDVNYYMAKLWISQPKQHLFKGYYRLIFDVNFTASGI